MLLSAVMNTVQDGIVVIDGHGVMLNFNRGAEQLFGYQAHEALKHRITMLMPPDSAERYKTFMTARLGRPPSLEPAEPFEELARRKDGTLFPVELSVSEMELGGKRLFTFVIHDISSRKQALQQIKESQERYALALAGINEGIWDWDASSDKLYISPRTIQLFGTSMAINHGRDWLDVVHHEDQQAFRAAWRAHLKGESEFLNCEFRLASDPLRWVRQRGLAYRRKEGRVARMAGSLGDITVSKAIEQALREALNKAEEASRAKSDFLSSITHELRTPLNAVIGFAEIIAGQFLGPVGSAKYVEYAKDITASATHLLSIINDILDMARAEAGGFILASEQVALDRVAAETFQVLHQRAEAAGIDLSLDIRPGLPLLKGDARRLKQVLINLVANAIKFTPKGGKVRLLARFDKRKGLIVEVSDTGIGMAMEDIPLALTPFTQIDSRLERRFEGTGLGLPLAKAFVEMMGGQLRIKSELGLGTKISLRFSLPCLVLD